MTLVRLTSAAVALIALSAGLSAASADKPSASPERALAGRTAGRPVDCIDGNRVRSSQSYDDGSIFFRMSGSPDYLNRPHACPGLKSQSTISTRTPSSNLCKNDILVLSDSMSRSPEGSCTYSEFVPYPRVRSK